MAYSVVNFLHYILAYLVCIAMIHTVLFLKETWFPPHPRQIEDRRVELPDLREVNASADSETLQKELYNWRIVSEDYKTRAQEYTEIGQRAEIIQDMFQTWFIVPWMIYIVASYLSVKDILYPWDDGGGARTSQIYYMFYQINQIVTLVIHRCQLF